MDKCPFEYATTQVVLSCMNNNASGVGGIPHVGRTVGQPLVPPDGDTSWELMDTRLMPWSENVIEHPTAPGMGGSRNVTRHDALLVAIWRKLRPGNGHYNGTTGMPVSDRPVTNPPDPGF